MRDAAGIAAFLAAAPALRGPLEALATLRLPDAWIGAGFIRNAVWDALCGLPFGSNPPGDVDAVWFDRTRALPAIDAGLEATLRQACPGATWSVTNQARMNGCNGDLPYADTRDAIAHWPETATAIAARLTTRGVEVLAPHGVADLLGLVVRPTPRFVAEPAKRAIIAGRVAEKAWQARWPGLTLAP